MKVTVIGAGMVGSSIAYAAMIKGVCNEIALVDLNKDLAEGQAMDLSHGVPYVKPVRISGGDYEKSANSDIVVITAGRAQKPGETRLELLKSNSTIIRRAVENSLKHSREPIFIIVSNPVDVLTWVAWKYSGLPRNRVIGSGTTLDTARLRQNISINCGLDPRSVHAYIIGEHGDSEIPSWSTANVGGVPIESFCDACGGSCHNTGLFQHIFEETRNAAYSIIEKKGSTYYGVGLAVVMIIESIAGNEHSVMTVSTVHRDYRGIPDVPFSIPTILGKGGAERVLPLNLSDEETSGLENSARVISKAIESLEN